ncbi:hypothetical protein BDN70DRAFT_900685 [Pholiota conissans]|uniref:Uncharacterized protein n=1 Tax=Pholiota conissans TaxID=109636 RepID=A0A9P6CU50_9AGAR|nr:hypothetical protein BDN70DRAFT_900685 [Pholiota conissans]
MARSLEGASPCLMDQWCCARWAVAAKAGIILPCLVRTSETAGWVVLGGADTEVAVAARLSKGDRQNELWEGKHTCWTFPSFLLPFQHRLRLKAGAHLCQEGSGVAGGGGLDEKVNRAKPLIARSREKPHPCGRVRVALLEPAGYPGAWMT